MTGDEAMAGDKPGTASVSADETAHETAHETADGTSEGSTGPSREARATFTFAVTGALDVFTLVIYGLSFTDDPFVGGVYLIGPMIGAAALLIAAFGLFRRRPWAESVVTLMLIVVILSGVATVLLTLAFGGVTFPIAAVVSVWALLAPRRSATADVPPGGWVLLGALVLSAVLPFVVLLLPPG
jgi:hypothetical protein